MLDRSKKEQVVSWRKHKFKLGGKQVFSSREIGSRTNVSACRVTRTFAALELLADLGKYQTQL